jgi:hypothetical protein
MTARCTEAVGVEPSSSLYLDRAALRISNDRVNSYGAIRTASEGRDTDARCLPYFLEELVVVFLIRVDDARSVWLKIACGGRSQMDQSLENIGASYPLPFNASHMFPEYVCNDRNVGPEDLQLRINSANL